MLIYTKTLKPHAMMETDKEKFLFTDKYEIDATIKWIQENNFKRVIISFHSNINFLKIHFMKHNHVVMVSGVFTISRRVVWYFHKAFFGVEKQVAQC